MTTYSREHDLKCSALFILNFFNVFGQRNSVSRGESFRGTACLVFRFL